MADTEEVGRRAELKAFLRSRRARMRPSDVGLPTFGDRRRVPGLRREELARPAGVGVAYIVEPGSALEAAMRRLERAASE
ncbi:hypothetical protein [Streptomyces sparsogenes]|uniref:hypothetical protein n=1 Tax=Streptomyces sparsogenes TaxID=67365 RepID=UPI003F4D21D5